MGAPPSIPLKSTALLHDVKKRDSVTGPWTLTRGELTVWLLVVLGIPALFLATRAMTGPVAPNQAVRVVPASAASASFSAPESPAKLNPNTATAKELELLPGIGPKRAAAIVKHREEHGPFRNAQGLAEIKGLSPALAERLAPLLSFESSPSQTPSAARP